MKKGSLKSSLFLLLAAFIWGVAFVAQSVGMDYMGPFSFNGARFILGALVLLPLVATRRQKAIKEGKEGAPFGVTLRGGILCGIALGSAALFQQFGIMYTTVGKAGFITTLYIILVPIASIFLGKKASGKVWIGAALAAVGMYLLCIYLCPDLYRTYSGDRPFCREGGWRGAFLSAVSGSGCDRMDRSHFV